MQAAVYSADVGPHSVKASTSKAPRQLALAAVAALAATLLPTSWTAPKPASFLDRASPDVLWLVAAHLPSQLDVLRLSQTCKAVARAVLPVLYHTVTLTTPDQCLNTLALLASDPALARHVTALVLLPDGPPARTPAPRATAAELDAVCAAVRRAAPCLDALHTFVWDADEAPPDDAIWTALRMACPRLCNVGSSVGSVLPSPSSALFRLRGLSGFALSFNDAFFRTHAGTPWPTDPDAPFVGDAAPGALWPLLQRAPLTSLLLPGTSALPGALPQLPSARWPALHTLVLGDVCVQPPLASALPPSAPPPFTTFLVAHPRLRTLHLSSRSGVPAPHLALLPLDALPRLREFGGTLAQAGALPAPIQRRLRTLRLLEPLYLREVTPLMVAAALANMPRLRVLSVAVVLHSSFDHGGLLRAIVSACPRLVSFEFTAAAKPAFLLETFTRAIRPLSRLRTLRLALVRVPGEQADGACAARLARAAGPRLARFSIANLPRGSRLPLRLVPARQGVAGAWLPRAAAAADADTEDACGAEEKSESGEDEDDDAAVDEGEDPRARARLFDQLGAARSTAYAVHRDAHGHPIELAASSLSPRLSLPLPAPLVSLARLLPRWLQARLPTHAPTLPVPALLALAFPNLPRVLRTTALLHRRTLDLRPVGHPCARRKPALALLFDGSAAGEEARLYAFCLVLAAVAAAFWAGVR